MLAYHHFLKKAWITPGLFVCVLILAGPTSAYDNPHAKDFQRAMPEQSAAKLVTYCARNSDNHTRCIQEITLVDGRGSEHDDAPPFCGSHDYEKITDDVLAWMRQHHEIAGLSGDDGIYVALTSLYPCK